MDEIAYKAPLTCQENKEENDSDEAQEPFEKDDGKKKRVIDIEE